MADEALEAAQAVLADREWPVTVRLRFPIAFGSTTIESLEFRKGRLADLKGITIGEMPSSDLLLLLASRLCGQPLRVIESIDPDDAEEVLSIALGFIGRCQGAGKKVSR